MTTLSGLKKSLIAEPSLKNSGLDTTSNLSKGTFFDIISLIFLVVPTGTVDFVTITESKTLKS